MACVTCRDGSFGRRQGKHSRRDLMRGAVALGLAAGSTGALHAGGVTPVAAQDDPTAVSPPPDYIPVHEGDVVAPIAGPLTQEPVSFSVVTMQNAGVSSFDDNRYSDWLEEKTNVHIDWQLVAEEEAEGQLNLKLASGDIPEMIFGIVSPSQQALYGSQGLFLLLNDLIDCQNNGLVIGTGSITVDLNGHTIDGVGIDNGIINMGFESATITNGTSAYPNIAPGAAAGNTTPYAFTVSPTQP